ncbi:MAG: cobaltochelatase subunit CobN, partial [Pleurocapsa sp.]
MKRIVLIAGFESFNANLYRKSAEMATARCGELEVIVFSDRDITASPSLVEDALKSADVFFASLVFDYDQVMWLRERVKDIPIRLVFESALELISLTQLGKFAIGDKPKGMPKPVKFILSKFSNGKEEDKLAGYISFLKTGPKLLKYIPGKKVQDLRNWLIIYGYWNAGGTENVASMCWTLAEKYLGLTVGEIPQPIETPNMGLLHPEYQGYFTSPQDYLDWHRNHVETFHETSPHPTVGILLYRKHVITNQPYIPQLIKHFESQGLIPLPIFIIGVEGHVAVRDWMTTAYEQEQRQQGNKEILSLKNDAVKVDAIVSTIGFPLVGGPAGSMEAGRQVEVAKRILTAKIIPYIVAAPLLIQDIHSWTRQGIGGLQSVVLYSLPELDGAIDTVPLGGLVGEDIYLVPERLHRLTGRLKNWIGLRQTPTPERKLAVILYNFPPGYGAAGTAALLNVPKSLLNLLHSLKAQGYDVGELPEDGEEIIKRVIEADESVTPVNQVNVRTLEKWLGYLQTKKIEKQWQSLTGTGIKTYGNEFQIGGVQFGSVWIGVQPPLGIVGDPMRLMFEKDLTPHPQYTAFYKWLHNKYCADAVVHFGMHGTVEWLPGSPLGNTGYSWSDILLGDIPILYIYAANNPSESILAKRRCYG